MDEAGWHPRLDKTVDRFARRPGVFRGGRGGPVPGETTEHPLFTRASTPSPGSPGETAPARGHLEFWILRGEHEEGSAPLTVSVPGCGEEALVVFGFGDEALLYSLVGGGGGHRRATPLGAGELFALLSGPWSGYGRVALDPSPRPGPGLADRPPGMDREDFLAFLASRRRAMREATPPGARR